MITIQTIHESINVYITFFCSISGFVIRHTLQWNDFNRFIRANEYHGWYNPAFKRAFRHQGMLLAELTYMWFQISIAVFCLKPLLYSIWILLELFPSLAKENLMSLVEWRSQSNLMSFLHKIFWCVKALKIIHVEFLCSVSS